MSSLVLTGDTSGQVTLAAPAVAGTSTITLAAQTGTLNVAGPAFSAYASSATNTLNATFTKLVLNVEEFDTNNNFDSTTNYRFTPTIAGYYQINGMVSGGYTTLIVSIYKNGTEYKRGSQALGATLTSASVSSIVYFNGSTDYVELWWYQGSGGTQNSGIGSFATYFNGCLLRGA